MAQDHLMLNLIEELAAIAVPYDRLVRMVQKAKRESLAIANGADPDGLEFDRVVKETKLTGASERTIQRYLKQIRDRWATEEVELRPKRREMLRQKLQATFLKAYAEGGPSLGAAVRCLQVEAKMDGLEAPTRVEVSGQIDVLAMSPMERTQRIEQLWAMRQAHLGSQAVEVIEAPAPKRLPAKTRAKKARKKPAKGRKRTSK